VKTKKKVKRTVKKLEADLDAAKAKAARWKKSARRHQKAADSSAAEVATLKKELKATRKAARPATTAPAEPPSKLAPATTTEVAAVEDQSQVGLSPDESWTVTALRAEARTRGIAGYSRKSKTDLLAALA
jgi:hypothetical protein